MLAALLLSLAVHAAPAIDPATLRALTEGVGARVAAHAGRPFEHLPELVLTRSDVLAATRMAALLDRSERQGAPMSEEAMMRARATLTLAQHVGLYVHEEDRIYLFEDNIQAYVANALAPEGLVEAYVACTLAHELTHALQAQVVGQPQPRNPLHAVVIRSLREGHANLIGEAVCRELGEPAVIGFDRGMQGIDALASRPRTLPEIGQRDDGMLLLHYGYGQRYVARMIALGGSEAVWHVLSANDLDMHDMLEGALVGLPPDIATPQATAMVASVLVPDASQQSSADFDTIDLLGVLGAEGLARIPDVRGAWRRERWDSSGLRVTVTSVRFDTAATPLTLVRARLRKPALLPWLPDARLLRRARVDGIARHSTPGPAGAVETIWAAIGVQLLVIEHAGGTISERRMREGLRAADDPAR